MIGSAGYDWVLIDLEHGVGSEQDVLHQLQALEHTAAAALVRVESAERQRFHRVLDMGAEGVMCPRINNEKEAKRVVDALRYPPGGSRGVAKMVRTTRFGQDFNDYYQQANDRLLGIVQIETREVLDHLEAIAALDGIDVLFIGPYDLSMSLGCFGDFDHPHFKDALKATVDAAQQAGKATGIILFDPEDFERYHRMGMRMIACGADATFVANGARQMVDKLNTFKRNGKNSET